MGGNEPNNEGRVTTREFFNAQLETNAKIDALALTQSEERAAMEIRLLEKLEGIPTRVDDNTKEIDTLRKSSNIKDWGILLTGVVGNVIAAVIGSRQ